MIKLKKKASITHTARTTVKFLLFAIEPFNNICRHAQNYFRVDTTVKQTAWEMYEVYVTF